MHWLQTLDTSLFRFVNQTLSNPVFDVIMPLASGNPFFAPLVLLAAAIFIWRGRGRAFVCVLMLITVVALGDTFVCKTIKKAVGRPRPFVTLSDARLPAGGGKNYVSPDTMEDTDTSAAMIGARGDHQSMPSSHAANWFAVTMIAFLYNRRSIRFMLPLAALVSFSRIYNGVHYPSDVLAGAILGAGYATVFALTLQAAWQWAGKKWFPLWWAQAPSILPEFGSPKMIVPQTPVQSAIQNPQSTIVDQHWLRAGYVLIGLLLIVRWAYLASGTIELTEDEAYQWLWSKHLALSYYSKPPLIAYTQFLGTALWGDNAFGVRFFSPLIAATLGFLLLRFFAREVSARVGFFLALIVNATPLMAVGATLMTVDPLSVLFWTAAMLAGWRAVRDDAATVSWFWVGLWMGLGFLSKYTELFQLLCWAVLFALWPPARRQLRKPGPYLAVLVNFLCALPVLIWNSQHQWITVTHVGDDAGAGKPWELTFKYLFEFVGSETILLNPVFFIGAVWACIAFWRRYRDDMRLVYFFSMGAPLFLSYLLQSFHARVQPNWIAPSVLPLLCVMVIYWHRRWSEGARLVKPALMAGLTFGVVAVIILHDTNLIGKIVGKPLPPKSDPLTRARAYSDMAKVVGEARTKLLAEGKPVFIIGNHYGITSLTTFYLPEARAGLPDNPLVYFRSSDRPLNQFYFWPGYRAKHAGQNAIFIREAGSSKLVNGWFFKWLAGETNLLANEIENEPAPPWLLKEFDSVTDAGMREVLYRGRVFHTIQMFECRNLR